jgi:nicotinamide mononucleotide transporter
MLKRFLQQWKPYEIIWLVTFTAIAIMLTIVLRDNFFGFTVTLTGCLCVLLTAKGKLSCYIFGMYNTFAYAWLAWQNQLYGEVGLNLLFFVPMNVIGFIMWKKKMNEGTVKMNALGVKKMIVTAAICLASIALLGFLLSLIVKQNTPYIDATTNILSVAATFLMIFRYKEQWLLYILLNIFTILLWVIRYINGSGDGAMMTVMWSAYLVNAVYGYINWSKGAKEEAT